MSHITKCDVFVRIIHSVWKIRSVNIKIQQSSYHRPRSPAYQHWIPAMTHHLVLHRSRLLTFLLSRLMHRLEKLEGGPKWTLSSVAGTFKFWKASESDRIFIGFQILCLIWLIKGQWIWICQKRCKISRLWRKMRFSYAQPLFKPEFSEINKQIRFLTKINAASNTAKPFIRTWKL